MRVTNKTMVSDEQKRKLKERAVSEARKFIEFVAYSWVVLSLFDLHKLVVLRQEHLDSQFGFRLGLNLINAVVLGKVVLIGEGLHLGEHFKDRPLIYPVLFKSAVYAATLVVFEIVEETLIGTFHGKTMAQSIPKMGGGGLEGLVLVGAMIFVVLIPLFAFMEIRRILGEAEFYSLLFKKRTKTEQRAA